MERYHIYSPYDSWYDDRNNMPLPLDSTGAWELGQPQRDLPNLPDDYLKNKYGLRKVYWYRHIHPPNYPQMFWRKWIIHGRKI